VLHADPEHLVEQLQLRLEAVLDRAGEDVIEKAAIRGAVRKVTAIGEAVYKNEVFAHLLLEAGLEIDRIGVGGIGGIV